MNLLLIIMGGVSATVLTTAAWLLLRVSDQDELLARRMSAARGQWVQHNPLERRPRTLLQPLHRLVAGIGKAALGSGVLAGSTKQELQQALLSSGFRGPNALPLFLGAKLVLMVAGPLAALLLAGVMGVSPTTRVMLIGIGFVAGLLAPDQVIKQLRTGYLDRLEAGLPDALDLMVICAQAGLSLEPAMARVAAEMRVARIEVAIELDLTVRELEVMASPQAALANLASRTGLPTLKRLVSTLVQTMQYGTPLSEALRTLSAELRQQTLTRFEERAARLPVLLTMPMILFILPCVFIIAAGPAALRVMKVLSH
jgi:tight adherence protein C